MSSSPSALGVTLLTNSCQALLSRFQALLWLGVPAATKRESSASRGLSGCSMNGSPLDVKAEWGSGEPRFGDAGAPGCGNARRFDGGGNEDGRRRERDCGSPEPLILRLGVCRLGTCGGSMKGRTKACDREADGSSTSSSR